MARESSGQRRRTDRRLGHRKSGNIDQEDKKTMNGIGVIFGFMLDNFILSDQRVELHTTRSTSHKHFPPFFHS